MRAMKSHQGVAAASAPFWTVLALILCGIGLLNPARAQGRPDILWVKGSGHNVFNLFSSDDGLTSIKVAQVANAGSTDILVRRINNADNTVLNSLFFYQGPYDVVATPDCLNLVAFEGAGKLNLCSALDGSVIWSLNENVNESYLGSVTMSGDGTIFGYLYFDNVAHLPHLRIRRISDGAEIFNKSNVDFFAFSPDSSQVMTQSGAAVSFWNMPTGSFNRAWSLPFGYIFTRGYSPNGQYLAAAAGNAGTTTSLFNVTNGSFALSFDAFNEPHGYHNPVWIGSSLYLSQTRNGATVIDSWTLGSSNRTALVTFPSDFNVDVLNQARSFDGRLAVMGDRLTGTIPGSGNAFGGYIRYFDPVTGNLVGEDDSPGARVCSVALTSDGASIVCASQDGFVRCYDRASASLRWKLAVPSTGSNGNEPHIAISPDDSMVALSLDLGGQPVSILSMADGSLLQSISDPGGERIDQAAFSPDGTKLVTASTHAKLWRVSDGALLKQSGFGGTIIAISPNGNYVAVGLGVKVTLLNASDLSYVGEGIGTNDIPGNANGVSFSPDSTSLAFSQSDSLSCFRVSDMSKRWLINQDVQSIKIGPVVFSPDGHVVTGYRNGNGLVTTQLQFLDALTGAVVKYFDGETGLSGIVAAFSSNGQYMAYGLADTTLVVANAPIFRNPLPTLSSLSSYTVAAGSGAFTLTLTGTHFLPVSQVKWNGATNLATTFISNTTLQALVPAALITSSGGANLTVSNPAPGGGASNALVLTIGTPQLILTVTGITRDSGGLHATLRLTNNGSADAANVQITSSILGTKSTTTALPRAVGAIPVGGVATVILNYPASAGGAGTASVLKVNGNCTGSVFSASTRVTLP